MLRMDVRLLGPTEIRVDGVTAPLPRRAGRAVLALLLLTPGRAVSTTTLIDGTFAVDVLPASIVAALGMSMPFIPDTRHRAVRGPS